MTDLKKPSTEYLNGWKRLFSAFLNVMLFVVLSFAFDKLFVDYSFKKAANYQYTVDTYTQKYKEYSELEDYYHLYTYNESSEREVNKEVTDADKEAFDNDSRVITLKEELPQLETRMIIVETSTIVISFSLASLVGMLFGSFVGGPGISFGVWIHHGIMVDKDSNKLKFKTLVLYGLSKWAICLIGGLCTFFIIPIVILYQVFYNEKHQSFLDKAFGVEYRVLEKYIGD